MNLSNVIVLSVFLCSLGIYSKEMPKTLFLIPREFRSVPRIYIGNCNHLSVFLQKCGERLCAPLVKYTRLAPHFWYISTQTVKKYFKRIAFRIKNTTYNIYCHVNVTFPLKLDEFIFLRKIREAKVNFDEGKRSRRDRFSFPVVQEFIVEENSKAAFEDMVQKLQLSRTEYSKSRNEYVKLFLTAGDKELRKNLIEAGINLRELKQHNDSGDLKAYVVEVSLIPQIKTIAMKVGIPSIYYNKTRLSYISVTFIKKEDEITLNKRLKRFHVPVEEIKMSDYEKWDQEYQSGKYIVDYFLEPHLFENFAYSLGVTLL